MSIVLNGVNHKNPFLPLNVILGINFFTIIHETLDLVKVHSRSLKERKLSFEVAYYHIEFPLRCHISSPSAIGLRKYIKSDYHSTETTPIGESS